MGKDPKQDEDPVPTGRIRFDERGNALFEWRTDTGTFTSDIDTQRVKALQESTHAQLGGGAAPAPPPDASDPYDTASYPTLPIKKEPRRTLDDMRRLSEEIKAARAAKEKK